MPSAHLSEFELIDRYFRRPPRDAGRTVLGVGDDGAIVRPAPGMEIVVSTDMLVAGTHFLADTDPADLGWKALAVNVSDMAAMGAQPRWALLAAALPSVATEADEAWIEKFAGGFFACADAFGIDVIGGDTTRGPRNFCVTIFGEVSQGAALLRSGARVGDDIWVSGQPGRAAQGLAHLQGRTVLSEPQLAECLAALQRPQPRLALGLALRGLATAAIDVSDGLLADLGHVLMASGSAARLQVAVSPEPTFPEACCLSGGDDYELVFTAPAVRHAEVTNLADSLKLALTHIGSVVAGEPGAMDLRDAAGRPVDFAPRGFDHFARSR